MNEKNVYHSRVRLSPSQKRMWFLYELDKNDTSYNVCIFFKIKGFINYDLLKNSINKVIARHDVLRTRFMYDKDDVYQIIEDGRNFNMNIIDVSNCENKDDEVEKFKTKELNQAFNLEQGEVMRTSILLLEKDLSILGIAFHHIVIDGVSVSLFLAELKKTYDSLFSNLEISLDPSYQYSEYIKLLDKLEEDLPHKDHLQYWIDTFANAPRILHLPTDYPRSRGLKFAGKTSTFRIPNTLKKQIMSLRKKIRTTSLPIFLAAFSILLNKYSNDEEINIGMPSGNRLINSFNSCIGLFVNTLAIKTLISKDDTFENLVSQIKQKINESLLHQETPFEQVVDNLNIERDVSRHPLFQASINMTSNLLAKSFENFNLTGAECKLLSVHSGYPDFDIALEILEDNEEYICNIKYSSNLFLQQTIERFANNYLSLITSALNSSDNKIRDLMTVSKEERVLLLEDWNKTTYSFPDKTVIDLFEENVTKYPNKTAIIFNEERLSYKLLNEKANQLAHYLIQYGVVEEQLIGICLERSVDFAITVLAILKARAAYLPMDPSFPPHRLVEMIEASKLQLLITQKDLLSNFADYKYDSICLQKESERISTLPIENPTPLCKPNALAYVIFTSGSTGKPKGVQIEHQSLTNGLLGTNQLINFSTDDRLLAFITFSFDPAVVDLFLPLIFGGTLVIASETDRQNVFELQKLIKKHDITTLFAPLSLWQLFMESQWGGSKNLNTICGGESLRPDLVKYIIGHTKSLWNAYGPTETTITSSMDKITTDFDVITIGRPLANYKYYILDEYLCPVPIGVPGELYIGGIGVARGYLNRDDLTQERFLHNPFSDNPNDRVYKTGDLVRYLNDGRVEFIGRNDNQVKIRGYRIELGDIEKQLCNLPEVREAVVIVREDLGSSGTHDKRLVAYIIPNIQDSSFMHDLELQRKIQSELKEQLRYVLPDYMIPSIFVLLEKFPLNLTGKINRKALPEPEIYEHDALGTVVTPRNATEATIFSIWHEVIGIPRISMDDDFFNLGGNSLLSMQVYRKLNEIYPEKIQLLDLFTYPTIEALANHINPNMRNVDVTSAVRIGEKENPWIIELPGELPTRARVFCFAYAGGGTTMYVPWRKYLPADISLCLIRLPGRESRIKETPLIDYEKVVDSIAMNMQSFLDKPYIFFGHSFGGILCYDTTIDISKRNWPLPKKIILSAVITPNHLSQVISPKEQQELIAMSDGDYLEVVSKKLAIIDNEIQQNPELLRHILPALRADTILFFKRTQLPIEKTTVPIVFLYNQDDHEVIDGFNSWNELIGKDFDKFCFPGGHFEIQKIPKDYAEFVIKELCTS